MIISYQYGQMILQRCGRLNRSFAWLKRLMWMHIVKGCFQFNLFAKVVDLNLLFPGRLCVGPPRHYSPARGLVQNGHTFTSRNSCCSALRRPGPVVSTRRQPCRALACSPFSLRCGSANCGGDSSIRATQPFLTIGTIPVIAHEFMMIGGIPAEKMLCITRKIVTEILGMSLRRV